PWCRVVLADPCFRVAQLIGPPEGLQVPLVAVVQIPLRRMGRHREQSEIHRNLLVASEMDGRARRADRARRLPEPSNTIPIDPGKVPERHAELFRRLPKGNAPIGGLGLSCSWSHPPASARASIFAACCP